MNRPALASKVCTTCGARYAADALFCPSDGTPLSSPASAEAAHAGGPDSPDVYLGREISGHIEIRQLAGVGAMGRVYRAFQKGIERDVAVKILHRELSANQQLVARFHREAKVASRLQHPNVVHVHLAGQLPDGAMYIVMEYLDGLSLQSALAAAGGAMPLPRALHIALQLCDAAGEAHAQGIVHRDLKPENVMLVRRGDDADYVKVLDFGIARLNWGEQSMATAAGLIFGTARYISPEGAQGEQVGPPGDVYSVATLLYQLLAGRTPFDGEQAVALLIAQIHDAPPDLRSLPRGAHVPDPIAQAVMKNLVKDPKGRDPDARAFGRAIIDAAKGCGMSPDELILRSGLLVGRGDAMQLPPMQRTKKLELTTELSERMAGGAGGAGSANGAAGAGAPSPGASSPTTKWTPPPGFSARLSPPVSPPVSPLAAPLATSPPSEPRAPARSVDETLDDASAPVIPAPSASIPTSTARMTPAQAPPLLPAPRDAPRTVIASEPSYSAPIALPQHEAANLSHRSNLGSTLDDAEPSLPVRRFPRVVALLVSCFLLGALLAVAIAHKRGMFGAHGSVHMASSADEQVARATDALKHKRWDAPPGDNVRDLTTEGLARWAGQPDLVEVRSHASEELVNDALGARFAGDTSRALHLARLAREFDASNTTAQQLVVDLERTAGQVAPAVPTSSNNTPIKPITPPPVLRPPASSGAVRALVDASNPKPRVGQPVELVGRILGPSGGGPKSPAEDPHFEIAHAGGGSVRLPAAAESATMYKATFSFLEEGRYDIVFIAKADGATVRASRPLHVSAAVPSPPLEPAPTLPSPPPPTPSGKWL